MKQFHTVRASRLKEIAANLAAGIVIIVIAYGVEQIYGGPEPAGKGDAAAAHGPTQPPGPLSQTAPAPASLLQDRIQRARSFLEGGNVPVAFWGKVVDGSGSEVPGVSIKYNIRRAGLLNFVGGVSEDVVRGNVFSAADGTFKITGQSGTTLSLEKFEKGGYELYANQNVTFGYAGISPVYVPNKHIPLVFSMRSITKPSAVKKSDGEIRLRWDGAPVRVDINTCKLSKNGELVLTPSRNGASGRFDWSLTAAIENGELVEANPGTAFIAPADGYLESWKCGYSAKERVWRFANDVNLFYRTKGVVGRLKLQIYADAGPSDVSLYLESFVNASGGRDTD